MQSVYLSSCQRFTAHQRKTNEFTVVRLKEEESDNDVVGWIRLYNNKTTFGQWRFEPLLAIFNQTDLLDLSMLIGVIKDDHDNDIDKNLEL